MVSQSLPATVNLCRQWRRLSHPEFYSDAGYDASRAPRGKLAEVWSPSQATFAAASDCFSDLLCVRRIAASVGDLSYRQTHLDTELGAVQRGMVFPLHGGALCHCRLGQIEKMAFPLIVIGMNSIAAYLIAHLIRDFTANSIKVLFGQDCFAFYGENYGPLCEGLAVLLVFWLILFWMYRRKIFLRI